MRIGLVVEPFGLGAKPETSALFGKHQRHFRKRADSPDDIGRFQKQQSDIFPSPALEDLRSGIGSIPHFRSEPTDFRGFLFADPSTAVQGGGNGHRGNTGFPGDIFQADSFLILHISFSV